MGLIDGVVGGLLGGSETKPTPDAGLGITLPTLPGLPGLPSVTLPTIPILGPTGGSSAASVSASASAASASAPTVPSPPPSSASSPSAVSVSAPPSSTFTPTSVSTPSAPTTPTTSPDVSTGNDGAVHTISHVVTETASAAATQSSAPAAAHESFLQNKALSGAVFALSGLVALVLIVILVTWVFRRRRRNRLLDDAVSFDPSLLATADQYNTSEKGQSASGHSRASLGTLGSARPGYGTYQTEPAQYNPYAGAQYGGQQQQQAYYGAAQQSGYYGGADYGAPPVPTQQPYYSTYVPPMADAPPPSTLAAAPAPAPASTSRAVQNIPRVPVPAKSLPEEFGSSDDQHDRTSIEESEFWAKTLKVTNE
ncbi:hypothetical protein DFH08DRAFT_16892 [Mycena albidolilacea]|uniref:Transmembrane protein n=1 Tax=Mycena albidolilacea TaxID=1033008 RepID=A0AAD7F6X2_9AGAR|nr:hypothetical protein DFH08DRAFT_16892 [Mycena albidolilacea]